MSQANKAYYDNLSTESFEKHRDVVAYPILQRQAQHFLQKYLTYKPNTILDVGCGVGDGFYLAKNLQAKYYGLDISEVNIHTCYRRFPSEVFWQTDFASFQSEQKFDVIVFFSTLHHFEDWTETLAKAKSLLSDRGMIFIESEPMPLFTYFYRSFLKLTCPQRAKLLRDVEVHWLREPSISWKDLNLQHVEFHCDAVPILNVFSLQTNSPFWGTFMGHYRGLLAR